MFFFHSTGVLCCTVKVTQRSNFAHLDRHINVAYKSINRNFDPVPCFSNRNRLCWCFPKRFTVVTTLLEVAWTLLGVDSRLLEVTWRLHYGSSGCPCPILVEEGEDEDPHSYGRLCIGH